MLKTLFPSSIRIPYHSTDRLAVKKINEIWTVAHANVNTLFDVPGNRGDFSGILMKQFRNF